MNTTQDEAILKRKKAARNPVTQSSDMRSWVISTEEACLKNAP